MCVQIYKAVIFFCTIMLLNIEQCFSVIHTKNIISYDNNNVVSGLGMILPRGLENGLNCNLQYKQNKNNTIRSHATKCSAISSRVFSARTKQLNNAKRYILHQRKGLNAHINKPKYTSPSKPISVYFRKSRHRVKRDRTLLAVQAEPKSNRMWPKWCKKLAYFRVFEYDYTLCLYVNDLRNDPILTYSNPHLGITSYGYGSRKSFHKMSKLRNC